MARRYWRVKGVTSTADHTNDGFGLVALAFLANGAVLAPSAVYASSNQNVNGFDVSEATSTDLSNGSGWYSQPRFENSWIAIDFGADVSPDAVRFASLTGFAWSIGRALVVQSSSDNATWTDEKALNNIAGQDGVVQTFNFGPLNARSQSMAIVVPTSQSAPASASAMAVIVPMSETPPPAGGSQGMAMAIVAVQIEYKQPYRNAQLPLITGPWAFPLFIAKGK